MLAHFRRFSKSERMRRAVGWAQSAYGFAMQQLWPTFSMAIATSVFFAIAALSEKQILADHFFGHSPDAACRGDLTEDHLSTTVSEAKQLLDEESTRAIKVDVFRAPRGAIEVEHQILQ